MDRRRAPPYRNVGIVQPAPARLREAQQGPRLELKASHNKYEGQTWDELTVRIVGMQPGENTFSVWAHLSRHGNISYIDMFESRDGSRRVEAKVKFSPPPDEPFWLDSFPKRIGKHAGDYLITPDIVTPVGETTMTPPYWVRIIYPKNQRGLKIPSPVRRGVSYDPRMRIYAETLHFGIMINPTSMMPLHKVMHTRDHRITLTVDLLKKQLVGRFCVPFRMPTPTGTTGEFDRDNIYMFQIPFGQVTAIQRMEIGEGRYALSMSLESPPQYYRKRQDSLAGHSDENTSWSEFDTWYRQTDMVYNPYRLQTAKVALHKEQPLIDIGRWTTYLFEFRNDTDNLQLFPIIESALGDFNIEIVRVPAYTKVEPHLAGLWSWIDVPNDSVSSIELDDLAGEYPRISLPFEVRYQLEVCISREILNEYNITKPFVKKLADISSTDTAKARNILEYVTGQEKRIYDPMTIFEDPEALSFSAKTNIPHYCAYSRKATITPTTIYFSSPTVETTNRVLRQYARENEDGRFLRVQFTDELFEGRINSCADKQRNDELFTRVYRTLFNGIQIGDRHYQFLAFGNSQFRENGAYFFCPTSDTCCDDIRRWMGTFSHIPVVAKYAARLGQCFSTTRAIRGISSPKIVLIPDVTCGEKNEYCFTDGVGKISPFLARLIAHDLKIQSAAAPSCFQYRLGGCKGILVVWPDAKSNEVHIRKSQQKFIAEYNGLEIVRCARFSIATLNRQTITILSSLGVPDEVFLNMLSEQLANYQNAMSNNDLAITLLSRYIDDNQMTINIAGMIRNGFMAAREPFVLSLLHLWRSWSIKLLKEKAKIIVENGAFVFGCVDETSTLRGYTHPKVARGEQFSEEDLPQIFIQIPDRDDPSRYNVIEGICLVGRNPSLHPGDLRVVQAVNVPALHHLRDVVVFPMKGDRDIPSMCSGGDLDGDDYFVIWDKTLRPPEWNCDPMNYIAPKPKSLTRAVEISDLMKFFVRYMKNDSLPTIAHAHLAQSDQLERSVKDPKCLELAALHSKAVDYVKSGEPAQMPRRLRPRVWPHFMEKKHKPKDQQYHSHKILGQLYDKVETVNFVPQWEEPFDKRILKAYPLDNAILKTARQIKSKYDTAMRRLMAQQEIKTEFEIWSTFVLSRPRVGSDYKVQEEIGRLSDSLKDQFREVCIQKAGDRDFKILGPFVAAMYKVTKEELDIALAECHTTRIVAGREVPKRRMEQKFMPLITFPWLFEKELGRIATGLDPTDDLEELGLQPSVPFDPTCSGRTGTIVLAEEDFVEQGDGIIVHRGEELNLFNDSDDDPSDRDEYIHTRDEHCLTKGESGVIILATEFEFRNGRVPDRSGTGVEDVVARTELDGFIDPVAAAKDTYAVPASFSYGRPSNTMREYIAAQTNATAEAVVPLRVKDSSSEKLARLVDTTPALAAERETALESEEEVVVPVKKESALERLARLNES